MIRGLRSSLMHVLIVSAAVLAPAAASAQTVVASARLGNNLEDATYVSSGAWAGKVAVLDGFDVIGVEPRSGTGADTLFSVRNLDIVAPRGIAFASSTGRFYFCIPTHPDQIFVTDESGNPQPPIVIGFGPDEQGFSCEGVSYIPPTATLHPDHLVLVNPFPDGSMRILVVRMDGTIDLVIAPPGGTGLGSSILSVEWLEDGKLAVSANNRIWTVDYDGQVSAAPFATVVDAFSLEGLALLDNGRLVAVDYAKGRLSVFNANGYRLTAQERDFRIGTNISRPLGIAWDESRDSFLLTTLPGGGDGQYVVTAVNRALKGYALVASPLDAVTSDGAVLNPNGGVTSIPGENLLAVATRNPSSIAVFDATTGQFLYRYAVPGLGIPTALTYDPKTRSFVVRVRVGPAQIVARDGTPSGSPDIVNSTIVGTLTFTPAPVGGGISWYKTPAGRRYAAGGSIYDTSGSQVGTPVTAAALGLNSIHFVTAITSGPYDGLFAAVNVDSSTVVIYSIP